MNDCLIKTTVELETESGEKFTLSPGPYGKHHDALSRKSRHFCVLDIKDNDGRKVGVINYWVDESRPGTIYLNWVDLTASMRGRGFTTAMALFANAYFREAGVKRLILDIPHSAAAKPSFYEKYGFKPTGDNQREDLTRMERPFD